MAIVIPDGKHPEDIFVIQNENYLMNNIEARHYTSYLFVNGVFNEDEMDSVDDTVEFQERNGLLLKILTEKGRDGYKVFKKALHKRGYLNMDLIEHKMKVRKQSIMGPKHIIIDRAWREFIDPKDETKVLQNRAMLIRKMDASRLTGYLATKQVIDGYDMTAVDTLPKPLANKELLRIVCGRGSTAFMWFVEALRVNGFGRLSTLLFGRPITSSTIQADSGDSDDSDDNSSSSSGLSSSDDDKNKEDEDTQLQKKDDEEQPTNTHEDQFRVIGESYNDNGDVQLHTISEETEQEQSGDRETQSDKDTDTQSNSNTDSPTHQSKDVIQSHKDQKENQSVNSNTATTEENPETQIKHEQSTDEGILQEEETKGTSVQHKDEPNPNKERESDKPEESVQNRVDNDTNDATESSNQSKSNDKVKPQSRNSQRSRNSRRKKRPRTPRSPFQKIITRNIIREPIDYVHAEKLRCHLKELETSLDAETTASYLVESGIIDRLDVETISALREPHQKARELISLVLWGGSDGFRLFLDALLETNQTLIHRVLTTQKKHSVRMNESAIPSIIIDEVEQSRDDDDDDDTQPLPTRKSSTVTSKQHKFRFAAK